MDLNIAFLQLLPGKTQEENLEKGLLACRKSKEKGADIALFPEIWNIGYDIDQEPETLRKLAVSVDSPFVTVFQELAKELQMAIGITFLESYHPAPRNTICLFDMYGKPVLRYAKVHTCAFDVEARLTPGDTFYVKTLQTAKGPIKVGAMICYDREFPESARIMMLKGAELILVPNACPMEINRLAQLRGRTYENMLPSQPATIRLRIRTATGTLRFLMVWFICLMNPVPGIPVCWKHRKKKASISQPWIFPCCGATARKNVPVPGVIRKNMGF